MLVMAASRERPHQAAGRLGWGGRLPPHARPIQRAAEFREAQPSRRCRRLCGLRVKRPGPTPVAKSDK